MSFRSVKSSIEQSLPGMHGWCTPEKGKRMAALVYEMIVRKPDGVPLCVELGVFGGRSLVAMALALKDQECGRVDGIDPYAADAALEGTNDRENAAWWSTIDFEAVAQSAQDAIDRLGLTAYARIVRQRSVDCVSSYADESIDVLHQDSNHSEEVSCREVELWLPKMRHGAYWIFDDTDWSSTRTAQRMLTARGAEQVEDHNEWKVYRILEV